MWMHFWYLQLQTQGQITKTYRRKTNAVFNFIFPEAFYFGFSQTMSADIFWSFEIFFFPLKVSSLLKFRNIVLLKIENMKYFKSQKVIWHQKSPWIKSGRLAVLFLSARFFFKSIKHCTYVVKAPLLGSLCLSALLRVNHQFGVGGHF